MIKVSKAQIRDMPHIVRLDTQTQEFPLDVDKAKSWFLASGKVPLLATLSKREVGFALALFNKDKDVATIERIGVHPKFRRVGIGRKIVERVALEVVTENIGKVQMIVPSYIIDDMQDPWNIEQWLWKLGFKAMEVLTDHFHRYCRDYDGYVFERMNNDSQAVC